jgi:hypothetical protein
MLAFSVVLVLAFVSTPLSGQGSCDMATVEKASYCENEGLVLQASDLVSNATYYQCASCDMISAEPGTCDDCEEKLGKKTSGKNVCKHCYAAPKSVEVCVKTFYECSGCGASATKAGTCGDCEEALEKRTSRALIIYVCPECDGSSTSPGSCSDDTCGKHGKALVRSCSESGSAPHSK